MGCYIGIDPGAKGAYCALAPVSNQIHFLDGDAQPIEIYAWFFWIERHYRILKIGIEDVHSIHGMSAKSNFVFGGNVRTPSVVLNILQLDPIMVTPKSWQKAIGVTAKGKDVKKNVSEICIQHYPNSEPLIHGKRGGLLDGRADALMISHYTYLLHKGKI